MGDPSDLEGRELPATVYHVEREKIREFAAAIGDSKAISVGVAPPTFAALYALAPIGQLLALPEVLPYTSRVIHVDQELELERPVRAGDVLTTVGQVERVRSRGGGWFITLATASVNDKGVEVARARATLLLGGA